MSVKTNYDPVYESYRILLDVLNKENSDINDSIAVEEAIGYLGEALA